MHGHWRNHIAIQTSPASLILEASRFTLPGSFEFKIATGARLSPRLGVQVSRNFQDWTTIMTVPAPANGMVLVDASATNRQSAFYRTTTVAP